MTTPIDGLLAGTITGVFGLRGEVKVDPTRIGADTIEPEIELEVETNGTRRALRVRSVRLHKGGMLVAFDEIDDATQAERLGRGRLYVGRDDAVVGDDEYLDEDLVGCMLVDENGNELGLVVAVEHYPASDMLAIGDARALVPLISAFIRSIDTTNRRIVAEIPPGLLDDRAELDT